MSLRKESIKRLVRSGQIATEERAQPAKYPNVNIRF